jgi:hypothetical protein
MANADTEPLVAPKNAALIVAALEARSSELYSKFPLDGSGRSMSSQPSTPACHQAKLNLRLHPSLQAESPGKDTGASGHSRLELTLHSSKTQLL